MTIAIDCRYIRERPSGIGTYVEAIVERLPALAPNDQFLLWKHRRAPGPLSQAPNVIEHVVPAEPNTLSTILWPQRYASFAGVELFHGAHNILPRNIPCRSVVTIHDILELEAPYLVDRTWGDTVKRFYFPRAIARAVRSATRLIVTTNAMADAVIKYHPQARGRLVVIPLAAGAPFRPPSDKESARQEAAEIIGTDAPFFLVVGHNNRRKQHWLALEAFARGAPAPWRLVLLQRQDTGRGLLKLANQLGITDRIIWLGPIEAEEMIALYQSARALIQPSLYEGFGLPVLEAMACGCPVIASDLATLREVIGDAGVFVPPTDVAGFARALGELARSEQRQAALSHAARERARMFSWDRCAEQTLDTYRAAVHS